MNLTEYSISELRDLIQSKKISPKELAASFLARIKKHDPLLHAYLATTEETRIDDRKEKGVLFGIPFSMKDTYMTKGFRTSAGSKVLENHIASYDATVISKLKKEGAVKDSVIKLNYIFTISEKMIKKALFSISAEKKKLIVSELMKRMV